MVAHGLPECAEIVFVVVPTTGLAPSPTNPSQVRWLVLLEALVAFAAFGLTVAHAVSASVPVPVAGLVVIRLARVVRLLRLYGWQGEAAADTLQSRDVRELARDIGTEEAHGHIASATSATYLASRAHTASLSRNPSALDLGRQSVHSHPRLWGGTPIPRAHSVRRDSDTGGHGSDFDFATTEGKTGWGVLWCVCVCEPVVRRVCLRGLGGVPRPRSFAASVWCFFFGGGGGEVHSCLLCAVLCCAVCER
jgi:hypothetical protein